MPPFRESLAVEQTRRESTETPQLWASAGLSVAAATAASSMMPRLALPKRVSIASITNKKTSSPQHSLDQSDAQLVKSHHVLPTVSHCCPLFIASSYKLLAGLWLVGSNSLIVTLFYGSRRLITPVIIVSNNNMSVQCSIVKLNLLRVNNTTSCVCASCTNV